MGSLAGEGVRTVTAGSSPPRLSPAMRSPCLLLLMGLAQPPAASKLSRTGVLLTLRARGSSVMIVAIAVVVALHANRARAGGKDRKDERSFLLAL